MPLYDHPDYEPPNPPAVIWTCPVDDCAHEIHGFADSPPEIVDALVAEHNATARHD